jgi:hypothetical protein
MGYQLDRKVQLLSESRVEFYGDQCLGFLAMTVHRPTLSSFVIYLFNKPCGTRSPYIVYVW